MDKADISVCAGEQKFEMALQTFQSFTEQKLLRGFFLAGFFAVHERSVKKGEKNVYILRACRGCSQTHSSSGGLHQG